MALRKNCLAYLCRDPHHYDVSIHVQYFIQLNNNEGLWLRWGQCLQHKHNKRFCANEEWVCKILRNNYRLTSALRHHVGLHFYNNFQLSGPDISGSRPVLVTFENFKDREEVRREMLTFCRIYTPILHRCWGRGTWSKAPPFTSARTCPGGCGRVARSCVSTCGGWRGRTLTPCASCSTTSSTSTTRSTSSTTSRARWARVNTRVAQYNIVFRWIALRNPNKH